MNKESSFKGLYVDEFLEIPTVNVGSTVKFRVNLKTSQLEFYHKQKKKWISNSFIDLSFENGLADILAIDDNFLYDTASYNGIENSNDVLLGLNHTWNGHGNENVISSISKLPYLKAIKDWNISSIQDIEYDLTDKQASVLKIEIDNKSNDNYYFLAQNNFNIYGPHQVRGFIYCTESNNKSFLTNQYIINDTNDKWEYIARRNEKWNPYVKPKGKVIFYLFLPYVSTGWHGKDKVIWKNEKGLRLPDNLKLQKVDNNCIISDTLDNILASGIELSEEYLEPIKNSFIKSLYDWSISTIEKFHVNNFIHHDLLLNRFKEEIQYDNDRNVNLNLEKKYPFMLHYAKEYNHSFINLSSHIMHEMCRYRKILRGVFLQYEKSSNIINSKTTLSSLVVSYEEEKEKIYKLAKDIYDNYKTIQ